MLRFALPGLAALLAVGAAGAVALHDAGTEQAIANAREVTEVAGHGIVEPRLTAAAVRGEAAALAALDAVVQERVLSDEVVRVKIWAPDGRVVYSDEPQLIGRRYPLGTDEREALATGRADAEVSDLSEAENGFEEPAGRLLEVYLPIRDRSGGVYLFETYQRLDAVSAGASAIWRRFTWPFLAALVLLWAVQLPLALRMVRRERRGTHEREALLLRAIEASDAERRRIAADLHDGVVQDMAGLSFGLAAVASQLPAGTPGPTAEALVEADRVTRQTHRRLRELLVEVAPPSVHQAGLATALAELARPLERDMHVVLDVPGEMHLQPQSEALLYRGAQEALRNVAGHAAARHVGVSVERADGRAVLEVRDDGRGFDAEVLDGRRREGHLGLRLLADLAERLDGSLDVQSSTGSGTRLRLEVPA